MNWTRSLWREKFGHLLAFSLIVVLLAGCEPMPIPAAATSTPLPPTPTPTPATTAPRPESAAAAPVVVQAAQPVAPEDAAAPVRVSIPEIGLDTPVAPMGWRVADVSGKRTTVWVLPEEAAGWHPNSAPAGGAGNLIISGHQLLGEAPFAAIALGEVEIGQEVLVTDSTGRVFVYKVSEVSEPIAIEENLTAEQSLAASMTSQSGEPRLTLISGWPDFSSTHRVFVTALFAGAQP